MKIKHHQIKNAVAHLSKRLESEFPTKRFGLGIAHCGNKGWNLTIHDANPLGLPEGSTYDLPMDYRSPQYRVTLDEIGSDESISLEGLFIKTYGLDKAIDAAWGFINHSNKIDTASLFRLRPSDNKTYREAWTLFYTGLDNKQEEIYIDLSISSEGTIFDIVLDYPKEEKAKEIKENFIRQSDEIIDARPNGGTYYGKGVYSASYKGFNREGEAIELSLKFDAQQEIILSYEIKPVKN